MALYKFPKYKKEQWVTTPDGQGVVKELKWDSGINWYLVNSKWYNELELHA